MSKHKAEMARHAFWAVVLLAGLVSDIYLSVHRPRGFILQPWTMWVLAALMVTAFAVHVTEFFDELGAAWDEPVPVQEPERHETLADEEEFGDGITCNCPDKEPS